MSKGHILGSRPAKDPLEEVKRGSLTVESIVGLKWADRTVRTPWMIIGGVMAFVLIAILNAPVLVIGVTAALTVLLLVLSRFLVLTLQLAGWDTMPDPDITVTKRDKTLEIRGLGNPRRIIALDHTKASSDLHGDLGELIRALDTNIGFTLVITMQNDKPSRLLSGEYMRDDMEEYLNRQPKELMNAFLVRRGGLWKARMCIIGQAETDTEVLYIPNSIKGAIPEPGLKYMSQRRLKTIIENGDVGTMQVSYYASGQELSDWLVQLASELAPEVGANVPGEFIAPIRPRPGDYRLGLSINPETLLTGSSAGIGHGDLEYGMLLCGGVHPDRQHVLTLLTRELLAAGKRVMIASRHQRIEELVALSEEAIVFRLGADLILNPVDAEGVPRSQFVSRLKIALESIAETGLSAAAEFEIALSRAVALNAATLADISLSVETDTSEVLSSAAVQTPSKKSTRAMEAVRILHQGAGARAFYGTQTVSMTRLAELQLSIMNLSMGSEPLDKFAFDLFCLKLTGLERDPDLVVILDDPKNLLVSNPRHKKHRTWTSDVIGKLLARGPTIVSVDSPSEVGPETNDRLGAVISLVLRDSHDIAIVADMLALSVVGPMHSKSRHSSRESSFLRVMKPGQALLVRGRSQTCLPISLDEKPKLEKPDEVDLKKRREAIIKHVTDSTHRSERGDTLLDLVAGPDKELAIRVLRLLERYQPLTQEALRQFIQSSGEDSADVESILIQLEEANMILRGSEVHSGVAYVNYRVTMKGDMALRQAAGEEVEV